MPLIKSGSDKARETNVKEMIASGHPVKQAVAASYSNQRKFGVKKSRFKKRSRHAEQEPI